MPDASTFALVAAVLLGPPLVLGLVAWSLALWRIQKTVADPPSARLGLDLPAPDGGWPSVSIVVPAHDEARVIEACSRSLAAQDYPDLELIFVLDRCTDDTRAILDRVVAELPDGAPRVRIIENDACPDDWAGKCHAAHLGAQAAGGAMLLFTDADTWFDPRLVRATVAIARREDVGLLSLLSQLTAERGFERICQPVAVMQLMHIYPLDRVNRMHRGKPFANGQFMLFDRGAYERIGGHEAVRQDLLEDIAFARRLADAGERGIVYLAGGLLRCSMYDSFAGFRLGWKRIFIEAASRVPARLGRYALRMAAIGVVLPVLQVLAIVAGALLAGAGASAVGAVLVLVAVAGLGVQALALARFLGLAGLPPRDLLFFPAGAFAVARILAEGRGDLVHGRPVPWAGRQYVIEPRVE